MSSTARVFATVNGPAIGIAVTTPAPISSMARTRPAAAVPDRTSSVIGNSQRASRPVSPAGSPPL